MIKPKKPTRHQKLQRLWLHHQRENRLRLSSMEARLGRIEHHVEIIANALPAITSPSTAHALAQISNALTNAAQRIAAECANPSFHGN